VTQWKLPLQASSSTANCCRTPQQLTVIRQGDSFILSRQGRTACRKGNYGLSAPSVPGASIPGTLARSPCGPSTVGFAPFSSSIRTTQPPTRIDRAIQRAESDGHFRNRNRLQQTKRDGEFLASLFPLKPEPQFSSFAPPQSAAQVEWQLRSELFRVAFPFVYLQSRSRLDSLCAVFYYAGRYLERHSRLTKLLSDRSQLRLCHSPSGQLWWRSARLPGFVSSAVVTCRLSAIAAIAVLAFPR